MAYRRDLLIAALGLALVLVTVWFWQARAKRFPYGTPPSDIQLELVRQTKSGESTFRIRSGDTSGEAVVTTVPTSRAGQALVSAQIVGVKSTFENSRAAYPGHITTSVDCHANDFVREQSVPFGAARAEVVLAVAGARRAFGTCSLDQIHFATAFLAGFDEEKGRVLTVKLFKPVASVARIEEAQDEILRTLGKLLNRNGTQ